MFLSLMTILQCITGQRETLEKRVEYVRINLITFRTLYNRVEVNKTENTYAEDTKT